jgi:hypothetical protein
MAGWTGKWPAGISYQSMPVQGPAGTAAGWGRGAIDADGEADASASEALGDGVSVVVGAAVALALGAVEAEEAPAEGLSDAVVQAATVIGTSDAATHRRR